MSYSRNTSKQTSGPLLTFHAEFDGLLFSLKKLLLKGDKRNAVTKTSFLVLFFDHIIERFFQLYKYQIAIK
jgi:hypothetical protein